MPKQTRARGSGGLIKSVAERAQARHEHQHCRRSWLVMMPQPLAVPHLHISHVSQQIMQQLSLKFPRNTSSMADCCNAARRSQTIRIALRPRMGGPPGPPGCERRRSVFKLEYC